MCIIEKLIKNPEWVYICWTKSELVQRYLLSKLTLPQRKQVRSSSEIWLWRQVPENWGFMMWFFLSWGVDHRIKTKIANSGRITSWTYDHPISHCGKTVSQLQGVKVVWVIPYHLCMNVWPLFYFFIPLLC